LELAIRIVFGVLEFYGLGVLTFSIFRLPVRENWLKLLAIAVVLEAVSVYQLHYLGMVQSTALLFVVAAYILLVKFIFNIRFIFTIVVCLVGYLCIGLVQAALVVIASLPGKMSTGQMGDSLVFGVMLQLLSTVINLLISYFLTKKKIGFLFFEKRISRSLETRGQDVYLLIVLLSSIGVLQLLILSFSENRSLVHLYIVYIILIVTALYITYQKNKKELLNHYNRLKDRNRSI